MRLSSYFRNKITCEIYCFSKSVDSPYVFGSSTSTKRKGAFVEHKNKHRAVRGGGMDGPCVNRIN
jgi:hypothetical protein